MTSISLVNVGTSANDGTGDSIRTAFQTVNNNFSYLTQYTIATLSTDNTSILVTANSVTVNGTVISSVYNRKLVLNGSSSFSNVYINVSKVGISDKQELRITSMIPIGNVWVNQGGQQIQWTSNTAYASGNVTTTMTYVSGTNSWMTF